jgi:DNA polymerase
MGIDSLRDLELAGVKWELSDAPKAPQHIPAQSLQNSPCNANYETRASAAHSAVPAQAPVNAGSAESAAAGAGDFDSLCAAIKAFPHPLKMFAKNTVPPCRGGGLLVITDAPSSDDDDTGRILSGAAGELFDKMLLAIGLERKSVAICPLVFWRAPGGRTPSDEELAIARPFVKRLIAILQPNAILTLGTVAANSAPLCEHESVPVISIPHPNYLILKPDSKKAAWEELQKLLKILQ